MAWLEQYWYRVTPLHILLLPLSLLFGLLAWLRRMLYRRHFLPSVRLPIPVIVVGNINVGGSGKTPLTIWLAQQLIEQGRQPGIISRGYGSKTSLPRPVSPVDSAEMVGDEPLLMAMRKICPVWVGHDRAAVGTALLQAHPECDVLISDDGLQHYRLQRDFEIAVIDGDRRFGNSLLLPAGPLRELPSRLSEVDAVVVNGGEIKGNEYRMKLEGAAFHNLLNPDTVKSSWDFHGLRLYAVAGIGNPQRFFAHLARLGLDAHTRPFPDHHVYTPDELVFPDADAILMTEKDAVKCMSFASDNYWALRVDAQIDPALARQILERIAS
jgi:tetraacyldisaccharide 4'-kinase